MLEYVPINQNKKEAPNKKEVRWTIREVKNYSKQQKRLSTQSKRRFLA